MNYFSGGDIFMGGGPGGETNLQVCGNIVAKEVEVKMIGCDFVFEKDYALMSLADLDNFIRENNHLPEIPPATVVEENGVKVGEMQSKLLQKIEELTLYMIELKQENINLKTRIDLIHPE